MPKIINVVQLKEKYIAVCSVKYPIRINEMRGIPMGKEPNQSKIKEDINYFINNYHT